MDKRELLSLAQSPIFRNMDILDLQQLLKPHNPIVKHYSKGETVISQGETLNNLIIVIEGKLKAKMTSMEGKVINLEDFGKYQPVAIPILFSRDHKLPVTLYALEDSEVFFLSRDILLKCCMTEVKILENSMGVISGKISFLSDKIKFLQLNSIKQKISITLLECSEKVDSLTFKMERSKEELAKEMAVTRPSLSREFSNLIQEGIISQEKSIITILDPERLKNYK